MQLTKDDVTTEYEIFKLQAEDKTRSNDIKKLDLSKFQQVVEFYEKYKDQDWCEELFHLWTNRKVIDRDWKDWLFSYCFREGLR